MKKYIIYWNDGFCKMELEIYAETHADAEREAYKKWRDAAENRADFGVKKEVYDARTN